MGPSFRMKVQIIENNSNIKEKTEEKGNIDKSKLDLGIDEIKIKLK